MQLRLQYNYLFPTRYNLTTGLYPFEGDNIYRLLENIGKTQWLAPEWLYQLDKHMADLVLGMLQAEPVKRLSLQQIRDHPYVYRTLSLGEYCFTLV